MSNFKNITPDTLREILRNDLPGQEAHISMLPKGRSLERESEQAKESAVMILLFHIADEIHICFTKRTENLRHHPGQISFPGGSYENSDSSLLHTALRETNEEIGISETEIQILGKLSPLYVSVSNFNIHPFIGYIQNKPNFQHDSNEVQEVLVFPLKEFFIATNKKQVPIPTLNGQILVPAYIIREQIIWGATSMIVAELEEILTKHYFRREAHSDNADNVLKSR